MSVMKEMQFPVSVRWRGGRLARAESRDKEPLELATPPEFRSGLAGYWSPEDLLVAATCSCFMLTLAAIAERREVPLLDATVSATGHMSRRDDGRFGFTVIEVDAVPGDDPRRRGGGADGGHHRRGPLPRVAGARRPGARRGGRDDRRGRTASAGRHSHLRSAPPPAGRYCSASAGRGRGTAARGRRIRANPSQSTGPRAMAATIDPRMPIRSVPAVSACARARPKAAKLA